MEKTKAAAIAAIAVAIPVLSIAVWDADRPAVEPVTSTTTMSEEMEEKTDHRDDGVGGREGKITVLASFYPLYDFAKNVGGDRADVGILIPPGSEPHEWDPSIRDIERMRGADAILINGAGLEGWADRAARAGAGADRIVDTSRGIQTTGGGQPDPHIWLNPVMAKTQIRNIADALKELDPPGAPYYRANAAAYLERLDLLDGRIRDELSGCGRDFVVYHGAFSYLAAEYGLRQHPIIPPGDSHAEPTPGTLRKVVEMARDRGVDVVFGSGEGAGDDDHGAGDDDHGAGDDDHGAGRIMRAIAGEIGHHVTVSTLSPIEADRGAGSGYVERMEQNLSNLAEALC